MAGNARDTCAENSFFGVKEKGMQREVYKGRNIFHLISSPIETWVTSEIDHLLHWMNQAQSDFLHKELDHRERYIWYMLIETRVNLLRMTAQLGIQKGQASRIIKRALFKLLKYEEGKVGENGFFS